MDAPLVIDLACGPGGFSDGAELAGLPHTSLIGFDWAYPPRASYRHGVNGYRRAYYVDLFKPEEAVERILRATGGRRPDWVIGSSSCKPFTTAATMQKKRRKRGKEDERDTLLAWCKVAGMLDPTFGITMENVPKAEGHPDWPEALNAINMPQVAHWRLKACDYGVFTSRERAFWGWRRDWLLIAPPVPSPVKPLYPSVIKCNGKRPYVYGADGKPLLEMRKGQRDGVERLLPVYDSAEAPRYLLGYGSGEGGWKRETLFTNAEALFAQGAPGKIMTGGRHVAAQQIADMIPPPLAAAVFKAATVGTGILQETVTA